MKVEVRVTAQEFRTAVMMWARILPLSHPRRNGRCRSKHALIASPANRREGRIVHVEGSPREGPESADDRYSFRDSSWIAEATGDNGRRSEAQRPQEIRTRGAQGEQGRVQARGDAGRDFADR